MLMTEDEEEPEVNRGGRPPYRPTDEERKVVQIAAAIGIPHEEIAKHLNGGEGIAPKTLRKHFRDELDHGMFKLQARMGANLAALAFEAADMNVRLRATMFYLERKMGWNQTMNQRHAGEDGGPIKYVEIVDKIDMGL